MIFETIIYQITIIIFQQYRNYTMINKISISSSYESNYLQYVYANEK